MIKDMIFIGNKNNPSYMIEINKNKKIINIYKPDKYSLKMKDFVEQYTLGETLFDIKYKKYYYIGKKCIIYTGKNNYFNTNDNVYLLDDILFELKDRYLLIKDDIYDNTNI